MARVLFKINKFPRLSETFILNQLILAINLGYDIKILVREYYGAESSSQEELFLKYNLNEKIVIEDYNIPKNKVLRLIKALFLFILNLNLLRYIFNYYSSFPRFSLTYFYEILFYKKFRNIENIHIQFGTNKYPIDLFKKINFLKGTVITSFHGHDLYFPLNGRIPKEGYYDDLFRYSDFMIANTQYLKKLLLELGACPKKILTIPVGVDTDFFKPQISNEKRIIHLVTIGRLEIFKGQSIGIECTRRLLEKGYDVKYTIVGDGKEFKNLEKLIKQLHLSSHISLIGSRNQKQIRNILLNSDIFLMTSITDPNYGVESQGLVSAEAQASGLPVIAFDTGGVKYTLLNGETGFLCEEGKIDQYITYIIKLINDPELLKTMGLRARKFTIENFSQNRISEDWKQIYKTTEFHKK